MNFNVLFLLAASGIWGMSFVAQSVGSQYLGPLTFNAVRFLMGALVLKPCIMYFEAVQRRNEPDRPLVKQGWLGGTLTGIVLCAAIGAQQMGIGMTSVGKAGFITALYIVLVPLINLLRGRKVSATLWASVALAVGGLWLLCMNEQLSITRGDSIVLLCAFLFSLHILFTDHYMVTEGCASSVDCLRFCCVQFFVCGTLSALFALFFEQCSLQALRSAWKALLYAGVMSSGVAYTMQALGQRSVNPAIASLLMSLEAPFSALSGWLFLGQVLSVRELWGCCLMFAAIILAEVIPAVMNSQRHE